MADQSVHEEIFRLTVETRGIEKNTREAATSLKGLVGSASAVKTGLQAMMTGFAVDKIADFTKACLEAGEKMDSLQRRMNLFGGNVGGFGMIVDAANALGMSIEQTGAQVQKLTVTGQAIGVTAREATNLVTTITQLGKAGGSSVEEINATVDNLSQTFQEGTASARDMKSIMQSTPLVAKAIADALGVGTQELQEMAKNGEITASTLRDALAGAQKNAQALAEQFPKSFSEQMQTIKNNWELFLGGLGQSLARQSWWQKLTSGISGALETQALARMDPNTMSDAQQQKEYERLTKLQRLQKELADDAKEGGGMLTREQVAAAQETDDRLAQINEARAAREQATMEENRKAAQLTTNALLDETQKLLDAAIKAEDEKQKKRDETHKKEMEQMNERLAAERGLQDWLAEGAKKREDQLDAVGKSTDELIKRENEKSREDRNQAREKRQGEFESAIGPFIKDTAKAQEQLKLVQEQYNSTMDSIDGPKKEAAEKAIRHLTLQSSEWGSTFIDAAHAAGDAFSSFLAGGARDFKAFGRSVLQMIGQIIIQKLIANSIEMFTAKGAAFAGGKVIPFARGGVVAGPTLFGMSGGRVGVMGEEGPEAVMPLKRMSGGKLGVSATAPRIDLINNTGVRASTRVAKVGDRTSIVLEAAELGAQIAEDRITRSMRTGYGATSTALTRAYSIRRRS